MWTFDDIEKINPPESGQKASILSHLLKIGSTWPKLLCDTADELDELGLKQARPEVISGAAIHARPAVYTTPFFVYTSHIRADR
jgi:hypothetical protein